MRLVTRLRLASLLLLSVSTSGKDVRSPSALKAALPDKVAGGSVDYGFPDSEAQLKFELPSTALASFKVRFAEALGGEPEVLVRFASKTGNPAGKGRRGEHRFHCPATARVLIGYYA